MADKAKQTNRRQTTIFTMDGWQSLRDDLTAYSSKDLASYVAHYCMISLQEDRNLSDFCRCMRSICNKILQKIRDEGAFSTMHTLLVYLQMAPMEQQPVIATLFLQLDLLVEPQKMSIYREEAIEALIEALRRKEFPSIQTMALDALVSLCGHLTASGNSYTEA